MSIPCLPNMRIMAGMRFSIVPAPFFSSIIGVSSQTACPAGVLTPLPRSVHSRMMEAAEALEFERAAELRDKIRKIEKGELKLC